MSSSGKEHHASRHQTADVTELPSPEVSLVASICQVDNATAQTLLSCALGSAERAVNAHFQWQHSGSNAEGGSIVEEASTMAASDGRHGQVPQQPPLLPVTAHKKIGSNAPVNDNDDDDPPSSSARKRRLSSSTSSSSKFRATTKQQRRIDHFFSSPTKKSSASVPAPLIVASHTTNVADVLPPLPDQGIATSEQAAVPPRTTVHDGTAGKVTASSMHGSKADGANKIACDAVAVAKQVTNSPAATHEGNQQGLLYRMLADACATLVDTSKRLVKLATLQALFRDILQAVGGIHDLTDRAADAHVLHCALDLLLGQLTTTGAISHTRDNTTNTSITSVCSRASTDPIPLQVSGAAVSQVLQTLTGVSRASLRASYRQLGDLGDVAAAKFGTTTSTKSFFRAKTPPPPLPLTIVSTHAALVRIATVSPGKGSQAARHQLVLNLLRQASSRHEIKFLVRTMINNMRLGATIKTILAGLAVAVEQILQQRPPENALDKARQEAVVNMLQQTYYICPRLGDIAVAVLQGGVEHARATCSLVIGSPVASMLAHPAHALDEVRKVMLVNDHDSGNVNTNGQNVYWPAVAEWKYDGVRCQAHWNGTKVTLFSRHLLDTTAQYPDAVQYMLDAWNKMAQPHDQRVHTPSFILDAEIVAVRPAADAVGGYRLLPFQDLSTRRGNAQQNGGGKGGGGPIVQVRVYAFDLLFLNGQPLLDRPLWERQKNLRAAFAETDGFGLANSVALPRFDEAVLTHALLEAVEGGAEGLMIKLTGQTTSDGQFLDERASVPMARSFGYEAGARSNLWLKLKRDYVAGMADTIDVVPIGAWYGNGRKAEKGFLSPILLAVYDDDDGVYRSISRCMSFTDAMYEAVREFYFHGRPYPDGVGIADSSAPADQVDATDRSVDASDDDEVANDTVADNIGQVESNDRVNCLPNRPSNVITNESPSIWFKPMEVFEVSFADLSLSRAHTAAADLLDDSLGRGVALRFPRFKRRRLDKRVDQATDSEQIARLFSSQRKLQH